jgi:hypothetical protein
MTRHQLGSLYENLPGLWSKWMTEMSRVSVMVESEELQGCRLPFTKLDHSILLFVKACHPGI